MGQGSSRQENYNRVQLSRRNKFGVYGAGVGIPPVGPPVVPPIVSGDSTESFSSGDATEEGPESEIYPPALGLPKWVSAIDSLGPQIPQDYNIEILRKLKTDYILAPDFPIDLDDDIPERFKKVIRGWVDQPVETRWPPPFWLIANNPEFRGEIYNKKPRSIFRSPRDDGRINDILKNESALIGGFENKKSNLVKSTSDNANDKGKRNTREKLLGKECISTLCSSGCCIYCGLPMWDDTQKFPKSDKCFELTTKDRKAVQLIPTASSHIIGWQKMLLFLAANEKLFVNFNLAHSVCNGAETNMNGTQDVFNNLGGKTFIDVALAEIKAKKPDWGVSHKHLLTPDATVANKKKIQNCFLKILNHLELQGIFKNPPLYAAEYVHRFTDKPEDIWTFGADSFGWMRAARKADASNKELIIRQKKLIDGARGAEKSALSALKIKIKEGEIASNKLDEAEQDVIDAGVRINDLKTKTDELTKKLEIKEEQVDVFAAAALTDLSAPSAVDLALNKARRTTREGKATIKYTLEAQKMGLNPLFTPVSKLIGKKVAQDVPSGTSQYTGSPSSSQGEEGQSSRAVLAADTLKGILSQVISDGLPPIQESPDVNPTGEKRPASEVRVGGDSDPHARDPIAKAKIKKKIPGSAGSMTLEEYITHHASHVGRSLSKGQITKLTGNWLSFSPATPFGKSNFGKSKLSSSHKKKLLQLKKYKLRVTKTLRGKRRNLTFKEATTVLNRYLTVAKKAKKYSIPVTKTLRGKRLPRTENEMKKDLLRFKKFATFAIRNRIRVTRTVRGRRAYKTINQLRNDILRFKKEKVKLLRRNRKYAF